MELWSSEKRGAGGMSIGLVEGAPGLTVKLGMFVDDFYVDVLNTGKLNEWLKSEFGENYGYL